jgi:hypothetical protein
MKRISWMLVAFVASASFAGAAHRNTGGDAPLPKSKNVLTPKNQMKVGGPSLLYAPSEGDDPAYRAAIAAITGGTVDYFDASAGTPTTALLANYGCVNTWANFAYADPTTYGNNLATYVDGGGRAILGVFCTFTQGNALGGAIMTPAYSPVVSPTGGNHFSNASYAGNGTTCIHTNVTTYDCFFRDILALQGTGIQDGSYTDNEIAQAFRAGGGAVIYNNGSGAAQLQGLGGCLTADWAHLVGNSCLCTGLPVTLQGVKVE